MCSRPPFDHTSLASSTHSAPGGRAVAEHSGALSLPAPPRRQAADACPGSRGGCGVVPRPALTQSCRRQPHVRPCPQFLSAPSGHPPVTGPGVPLSPEKPVLRPWPAGVLPGRLPHLAPPPQPRLPHPGAPQSLCHQASRILLRPPSVFPSPPCPGRRRIPPPASLTAHLLSGLRTLCPWDMMHKALGGRFPHCELFPVCP